MTVKNSSGLDANNPSPTISGTPTPENMSLAFDSAIAAVESCGVERLLLTIALVSEIEKTRQYAIASQDCRTSMEQMGSAYAISSGPMQAAGLGDIFEKASSFLLAVGDLAKKSEFAACLAIETFWTAIANKDGDWTPRKLLFPTATYNTKDRKALSADDQKSLAVFLCAASSLCVGSLDEADDMRRLIIEGLSTKYRYQSDSPIPCFCRTTLDESSVSAHFRLVGTTLASVGAKRSTTCKM